MPPTDNKVTLTVRIEKEQGERFKHMKKVSRYTYGEWLIILMDHFNKTSDETSLLQSAPLIKTKLGISIEEDQAERFKQMTEENRYSYGQFLTILMNRYEGK